MKPGAGSLLFLVYLFCFLVPNIDLFFKLHFIMLLQLSWLFPLWTPPLINPHIVRQSRHHCSCPWVMWISSLDSPFLTLYFTSPWLFCNYLFVLLFFFHCGMCCHNFFFRLLFKYFLIPLPLHPLSHMLLPTGKHQNTFCIHVSVSIQLVCLVGLLDSIVDRYIFFAILLFIVSIFLFLNKSL